MMDNQEQKTISVDFDGVIHRYAKGWHDGTIYDVPVEGCQDALKRMVESGYRIFITSSRVNHQDAQVVVDWLEAHGMHNGEHWHGITRNKVSAIAYIDDRAVRFTNWTDMVKMWCWTR